MPKTNTVIHKKKALLEALEKSLGVATTACQIAGVDRSTFYKYLKKDLKFAAAVKDIENIALDFAESKLHKQIKDGNTAATIFYLKTKGRNRGYVERKEIDAKVTTDDHTPEQRRARIQQLMENDGSQ